MEDIKVCRECGSYNLTVTDSREMPNGCVRRARKCRDCNLMQYTVEMDRKDYEEMTQKLERYKSIFKTFLEVANEN